MRLVKLSLFALLSLSFSPVIADVDQHFAQIKSDPNALYAFFKTMPKGGELHYHLAGGAYPETMLTLAAKGNYCLDKASTVSDSTAANCDLKAAEIISNQQAYNKTIRDWSMKNFIADTESGHDHFFATFFKFAPLIAAYGPQLLAEVMERAANQNELYLEVMILPDNGKSISFAQLIGSSAGLAQKKQILLANKEFENNISWARSESTRTLQQAREIMSCQSSAKRPGCDVLVKFQYFILREQALDSFFAQALTAFAAASQSTDIVGINIVQAEDGIIALRDYRAQMQIINFMHQAYPNVHIALHAGELSPSDLLPSELRFHIHDAIFTAHAERIGHGIDIAYEDGAEELVKHMAKARVAVEINLISNQSILNISGPQHPLHYYLAHKVPVVLSTDDEGILRTDLTRQYVEAVLNQGLDYQTLKMINRNTLTYSFLNGKSLWLDPDLAIPISDCKDLGSPSCQAFISNSDKATLQWRLENELINFEKQYSKN